ncbi:hypothetical protein ABIE45_002667 [Methylobacterium sp. OAE515]
MRAEIWRASDERSMDEQHQVDDVRRVLGDTLRLRGGLRQIRKRVDALDVHRAARGRPESRSLPSVFPIIPKATPALNRAAPAEAATFLRPGRRLVAKDPVL